MASGALLSLATIEVIFCIDVITALIAIVTLLFFLKIPVHAKAQEEQTTGYISDFKDGLVYIKNHDFLKKLFTFFAVFFILAAPVSFLTPLQVTRTFGDDVWRLTAIEVVFSIGMMIGGALIATWGGFKNRTYSMTVASFIFALCTFALGVVPTFTIYLVFMGIVGIGMPLFNTPVTVLLQEKVEVDYLGRVFGVMGMISSSMMPLGMLVFGPISNVIDIEWLLIGTGIAMFILGFFLIGSKVLVEAGKPKTNEVSE